MKNIIKNIQENPQDFHYCNNNCSHFPCHINIKEFNCKFCYCPLYFLPFDCGGSYTITKNLIKDCSQCIIPHDGITGTIYIMQKLNDAFKKIGDVVDILHWSKT